MFAVASTDNGWHRQLCADQPSGVCNFWTPTPWNIRRYGRPGSILRGKGRRWVDCRQRQLLILALLCAQPGRSVRRRCSEADMRFGGIDGSDGWISAGRLTSHGALNRTFGLGRHRG
jgi:hypothetical protein